MVGHRNQIVSKGGLPDLLHDPPVTKQAWHRASGRGQRGLGRHLRAGAHDDLEMRPGSDGAAKTDDDLPRSQKPCRRATVGLSAEDAPVRVIQRSAAVALPSD